MYFLTHSLPRPNENSFGRGSSRTAPLAVILRENVLSLKGNREQLPMCCAHMIYCLLTQQPYNLACFFSKRIVHLMGNKNKLIPYGMFLTCLYQYTKHFYPYLRGPQYSLFNRVMESLNESYISSILIFESSTNYAPFDDLTHEEEVWAKVESVMQRE